MSITNSTDCAMIRNLYSSVNGRQWLSYLPNECIGKLCIVESRLIKLWKDGRCFPKIDRVLKPFHMIEPTKVKMVMLCKEPYASDNIATGIPVDTGGDFVTPSLRIFMGLISKFYHNVNAVNAMYYYYTAGILVINSSFTKQLSLSLEYELTDSHYPVWTEFVVPLIQHLSDNSIPILAVGNEAKQITNTLKHRDMISYCSFPKDHCTIAEFYKVSTECIANYCMSSIQDSLIADKQST